MNIMKLTWQCLFSPRLYRIYKDGPREAMYEPQELEKWSDKIITTANSIVNIGLYTSPFICMYIYKRGFFTADESRSLARFFGGVGCLIAFCFLLRGIGRAFNPKYVEFLKALNSSNVDTNAYLAAIRAYDFEFKAWPVTFSVAPRRTGWLEKHPFSSCANPEIPHYQQVTIQLLAYVAAHTFAIRLIYPGSLGIIQNLLGSALLQGRTMLVEVFGGQRTKIRAADGNTIDTMFVDNRSKSPKGKTLVICTDGNSGFYEIGIMTTPIKAGYSALGWNHPGFGGSTGTPFPPQEQDAMDAVMRFAINELGFDPQNIIMFGWSIGGYTSAWAASQYPVKGLILDATFDDLLPLAQHQMPASWSLLVKEVVRSYADLNIAELVSQYTGPVHLVRRTEDEIICLRQGQLSTNRANYLLLRLLDQRHPDVTGDSSDGDAKVSLLRLISQSDVQRAANRGELAQIQRKSMNLISQYMRDFKSTHCTPLPEEYFEDIMDLIERNHK